MDLCAFEDPFASSQAESTFGTVNRFFNVSRVRSKKESLKLIKLLDLVNEDIDNKNKQLIANAQPKIIRFKVYQHYKDRIKYLVQMILEDDDLTTLCMLELNSPSAYADGEIIYIDRRLLQLGGVAEYQQYFPNRKSMTDGKASVREVKHLLPTEENMKIEVELLENITRKEFLSHLKQGNSYNVITNDLLDCNNCYGGYFSRRISDFKRERVACSVCNREGKLTKRVNIQIVWDPSRVDVEGDN